MTHLCWQSIREMFKFVLTKYKRVWVVSGSVQHEEARPPRSKGQRQLHVALIVLYLVPSATTATLHSTLCYVSIHHSTIACSTWAVTGRPDRKTQNICLFRIFRIFLQSFFGSGGLVRKSLNFGIHEGFDTGWMVASFWDATWTFSC